MRRLALILLCSSTLHAQPPGIDSMWTFPTDSGAAFGTMELLPDGGYLFGGGQGLGSRGNWFIMRCNSHLDTLWTQTSTHQNARSCDFIVPFEDRFLAIGDYYEQIDSNTWTTIQTAEMFSLDGEFLWEDDFLGQATYIDYNAFALGDNDDAYLMGDGMYTLDSVSRSYTRVVHVTSQGEILWESRFATGGFFQGGDIVRLADGRLVVATFVWSFPDDFPSLVWLSSEGDSLHGVDFPVGEDWFPYSADISLGADSLYHLTILEDGSFSRNRYHWIRFTENGEVITEIFSDTTSLYSDMVTPVLDGLLVAGMTPWQIPDRDIVLSRLAPNGQWMYASQLPIPNQQSTYAIKKAPNGVIALLGSNDRGDLHFDPTVFFLSDEGPTGYIYASPTRLDFGVVPLDETESIVVQLHLTGDTSAIITDLAIPENFATGLHTPDTVYSDVPFEFLIGFRPTERRIYADTLRLFSTGLNSELIIPLRGQAPFPVLEVESELLDFHWVHLGDSLQRQFTLFNIGTDTLFVQELDEHPPFYFDTLGPFTILADGSLTLDVTFHPWERGRWEHWLYFNSNDPEELDSVRLLGRCVSPSDAEDNPEIPREFKFYAAFPNPFNNSTTLRFDLPRAFHVKLTLYNLAGQEVAMLADTRMNAGTHTVSLETASLASGLYFAHIIAGENVATQKLVLLK